MNPQNKTHEERIELLERKVAIIANQTPEYLSQLSDEIKALQRENAELRKAIACMGTTIKTQNG